MSGVTAILSSFNRPDGLRRSFESLWNQARHLDEIIVCDDGSQNGEVHLLLDQYEALSGVKVIRGEARAVEHKKVYCTFTELINRALDQSEGDYFCYLTDGNEYTPDAVHRHVEILDAMSDIFLVWGMVQNIQDDKLLPMPQFGKLTPEYIIHHLPQNNFVDHSSVMHRRTNIRWDTDPGSWRYADWLFWRRLLNQGYTFVNHKHHCLNFYMDGDSFGRCLIENHMSFEETMKLKMQGADCKQPTRVTKEPQMENRVKYAKNASEKIQSDLKGGYHDPGALVLIDDVRTGDGGLCPGFIPFGTVPEYEPRKTEPKKPMLPGEAVPAPAVPKTPFAGMATTVDAARKKAEEMEAEEKPVATINEEAMADLEALYGKEAADAARRHAVAHIEAGCPGREPTGEKQEPATEAGTDGKKTEAKQNAAPPGKKKKAAKKKSAKKAAKKWPTMTAKKKATKRRR